MNPTRLAQVLFLTTILAAPVPSIAGREESAGKDAPNSEARRAAIVVFCRKHKGRKVGNGECWTLANEAFKHTGATRPGGALRVWGRRLNLRRESPLPGDILECDRTRFSDGYYVPVQHTAVIIGVHSATRVRIAEQNVGGVRKVKERDVDLSGIRGGTIAVFRPQ
jgi:hypothetical protein